MEKKNEPTKELDLAKGQSVTNPNLMRELYAFVMDDEDLLKQSIRLASLEAKE